MIFAPTLRASVKTGRLLLWLAVVLQLARPALASDVRSVILHIDGVAGDYPGYVPEDDSTLLYVGDIQGSFCSWSAKRPPNTNDLPGTLSYTDLVFTKVVDKASPLLARFCATATNLHTVVIHVLPIFGPEAGILTLSNAVITGVQASATNNSDGTIPENILLHFSSIAWSYPLQQITVGTARLYLPGVDNHSPGTLHTNWLPVFTFTFGASNATVFTNHAVPPVFPDITLTHFADKSSSNMVSTFHSGTVFTNVIIDGASISPNNSAQLWYHLKLQKAWLSSFSESLVTNSLFSGDFLLQTFQLHYSGDVTWSYALTPTDPSKPDTFVAALSSANGPTLTPPFATVTGLRAANSGQVILTWPAVDGATYQILKSAQILGPFQPVTQVVATNTGPMSYTITQSDGFNFYRVRLPFVGSN